MTVFDTYRSAIGLYYGVLAGDLSVSSESIPPASIVSRYVAIVYKRPQTLPG